MNLRNVGQRLAALSLVVPLVGSVPLPLGSTGSTAAKPPLSTCHWIHGTEGDDVLYARDDVRCNAVLGNGGNDRIYGSDRVDYLFGGGGADWIEGRGNDDVVWGGNGDDSIIGGPGRDELFGFGGDDTFLTMEFYDGEAPAVDHVDGMLGVDCAVADPIDVLANVEESADENVC